MNQIPMTSTMMRPTISTTAIAMLITTDSVMPMKLTTVSARMKSRVTSSGDGLSHSVAK